MVIDHDIQVIDVVSDRLMVFTGRPGVEGVGSEPLGKEEGMNLFLRQVGLTYRRDVNTGRPRVNKPGSKLDREQKERGDRKSTRLNSSHSQISYAVFCLK